MSVLGFCLVFGACWVKSAQRQYWFCNHLAEEGRAVCFTNGLARTLKGYAHKKRLLDQAVVLFNCIPFKNGNFS